ncbi:hypothetical protein C8A01DRAFT_13166 [Parachaetomium inaequale]|uniref:DUF4112 domain-containing protein n=1 Tax=Parachaetomium inaequale TaxID=2588326 RepID=A0AAN6PLI8_9PEZI|nr:hypothetical protein C8A01DRAFT_13166 [Parachaetomium inaequale]
MNAAVNILGKKALKRYGNKSPNSDNPYKDRKGKKREPPPGLSTNDVRILKNVRKRAYRWDQQFNCCCLGFRFGWSAILGLIPVIGDGIEVLISLSLIRTASKVDGGLPKRIYSLMITYIILDFAFGFIPVLGDLVDFAFRANTRNAWLLESYLTEKGQAALNPNRGILDEETGEVVEMPPELQVPPEDRDVEQGVEPVRMVEQAPPILAALPPARTPSPKEDMPPPGRNLTGRQPQDPRDRRGWK